MPPEAKVDVRAALRAIEALRPRYVDFLRRRLGNDAEDVYQQCILKALDHAAALRDVERVQAWFWRLVRNAAVDHHAARVACEARASALAATVDAASAEEAAVCACALGLLARLPPAYAEILRRVDVDDEPVTRVARALGITANNASVRLHRARQALREQLQGCCKVSSMRACFACTCADEWHPEP